MSPNEGKTPLEQGKSLSRSLMSYTAKSANSQAAYKSIGFSLREADLVDAWVKSISDLGVWYVFVGSDGRGVSRAQAPDSEKIARVIDTRGEMPLTKALERICKNNDHVAITDFRRTLRASEESYNDDVLENFRREVRLGSEFFPGLDDIPIVSPRQMVEFSRALASLRSLYFADSVLYGSIAASAQLAQEIAIAATPDEQGDKVVFSKYVAYITSGEKTNPVWILSRIVREAIGDGHVEEVISAATEYRQKVGAAISKARAAETIDESLDKLYDAIPQCHAAHIIYATLADNGVPGAKTVHTSVDETLVRMCHAFSYQVLDFEGRMWKYHRDKIKLLREQRGEEAAEREAKNLSIRDLIYPRKLIPSLLSP